MKSYNLPQILPGQTSVSPRDIEALDPELPSLPFYCSSDPLIVGRSLARALDHLFEGRQGLVLEDTEVTLQLGTEVETILHGFGVRSQPVPRAFPCQYALSEMWDNLSSEGLELPLRFIP